MPTTLGSNATTLGPQHILCSCLQLGCSQKRIEYMGKVYEGRLFSRTRYPKHLAEINSLSETTTPLPANHPAPQREPPGFAQSSILPGPAPVVQVASTSRAVLQPALPPIGAATAMRSNKRARDTEDDESMSGPRQPKAPRQDHGHMQITTSTPRRFLQDPLCMREMFKVAKEHLFHNVGVKACNKSLAKARESVKEQKLTQDPTTSNEFWKEIPLGLPTLLKTLKLEPSVQSKTCCPFCCALSSIQEPLPLNASPVPLCDVPRFTTKASTTLPREPCQSPLYEKPSGTVQKPMRLFFYQSLRSWLGKMLQYHYFEEGSDAHLNRQQPANDRMDDIWDGTLWKTFQKDSNEDFSWCHAPHMFQPTSNNTIQKREHLHLWYHARSIGTITVGNESFSQTTSH
ncbi:uncharacterized protein MELLADRAFT_84811 [Melampsora larici-populina 98AG31]|uniref:Uncharacterized protein n=1 Tax=Melampsora larici-populina (strain 98AG31 / pathotype 3-4-7) TaxID=747676 RepID=F4SCJ5_MELLP|nr:uncharacterized protein MELLADRAFT_84811 [Melampsora larici-populina 98AG31]EGF97634.1 hypothetical protein MELLADRAFT_84811 [Melampsora larici-populina 98AG31]